MFVRIQYYDTNLPSPIGWGMGDGGGEVKGTMSAFNDPVYKVCFSKFICLSVCPLICLQTMIVQALIM